MSLQTVGYPVQALEEQAKALEYLTRDIADPMRRPGKITSHELMSWQDDALILHQAEPYFWNSKTCSIVKELGEQFALEDVTVSRHLVQSDFMFHYFEEPWLTIEDVGGPGVGPVPVKAITTGWARSTALQRHVLSTTAWGETDAPDFVMRLVPLVWAARVEDATMASISGPIGELPQFGAPIKEEIVSLLQFVVAANTFLRQRLLRADEELPGRQARKRAERKLGRVPVLCTINMRRVERKLTGEHHDVEWKWQWSVKGHVRKQWYASLGKHLPVYIHEHWKGPEDAPVKPRVGKVFAVTR